MRVHPVEPSIARLGRRRRRLRRDIRGWHVRRRDARASTRDRRPGAARGRALASPNLPAASGDVERLTKSSSRVFSGGAETRGSLHHFHGSSRSVLRTERLARSLCSIKQTNTNDD
jgi:hypothetical protein